MHIFINGISQEGVIILFDENRHIVDSQSVNILWRESKDFPTILDTYIRKNIWDYSLLKNICVVNWPWSFTGIRSIVLTVNTLKFLFPNICITSLSFFDLYPHYPIVKASSKKDVFFKEWLHVEPEVISNEELVKKCEEKQIQTIYWDSIPWMLMNFEKNIDYGTIIQKIELKDENLIEPLYLKKPNIS